MVGGSESFKPIPPCLRPFWAASGGQRRIAAASTSLRCGRVVSLRGGGLGASRPRLQKSGDCDEEDHERHERHGTSRDGGI